MYRRRKSERMRSKWKRKDEIRSRNYERIEVGFVM
jgi:hypothetical protein